MSVPEDDKPTAGSLDVPPGSASGVAIPEDQRWVAVRIERPSWLTIPIAWLVWPHATQTRERAAANENGTNVCRLVTADEWDAICAERARLEEELVGLARLALHTTRRDVELFVHRLAYRHRSTPLGDALAAQDVVPAVSLRTVAADEARLAKLDRIEAAWRRYMAEPDLDDMSDVDRLIEVLVLTLDGEL